MVIASHHGQSSLRAVWKVKTSKHEWFFTHTKGRHKHKPKVAGVQLNNKRFTNSLMHKYMYMYINMYICITAPMCNKLMYSTYSERSILSKYLLSKTPSQPNSLFVPQFQRWLVYTRWHSLDRTITGLKWLKDKNLYYMVLNHYMHTRHLFRTTNQMTCLSLSSENIQYLDGFRGFHECCNKPSDLCRWMPLNKICFS